MKTRQDNDVTDHTGLLYAEYEIELSWTIPQGKGCDKYQIG